MLVDRGPDVGERRLGAIMFTDIVGYSSMTSANEGKGLRLLEEHRRTIRPVIRKFHGIEVKTIGDAFLVEFPSAVDAVNCSVEIQNQFARSNALRGPEEGVRVRIGIHVGDIVHSGGDVLGDAVNVAARVEPLAEPGGILVTRQVVDQVERKVEYPMRRIGSPELKNIGYPVEVYKVIMPRDSGETGGKELDPKRLAILPFANMSPDPNDRYFADGMTEELISTVSRIKELAVISRTSVMRYRETETPISRIGRELNVGSVIEGSVRKADNKVRITVQLIEVEADRHLWSQSYDRDLKDVFAIQGDIAEQVAGSLKIQLLAGQKLNMRRQATSSPEAYTLYLKGRYYWNERTEDGTNKALRYFDEALKLDPAFAMAHTGLADSYNILSDYGWMDPGRALPLAKAYATKALELDDSLAEAHASLGITIANLDWDFTTSEREYRRAIELKPNYAPAYHWYALNLTFARRHAEAAAAEKRALALDPYSRVYRMASANNSLEEGSYEEAMKGYLELVESYPDFGALRLWKAIAHVVMAQYDKAIQEAKKFVELDGGSWTSKLLLAWVYAEEGSSGEARKLTSEAVEARTRTFVSPTNIGWVKLTLGETKEGYEWLEKALLEKDPSILYFNGLPWMKKFRADPRWVAIEKQFRFRSEPE